MCIRDRSPTSTVNPYAVNVDTPRRPPSRVPLAGPAWSALGTRLGCLRGASTLTAVGLTVEVGDWSRFTGSSIGAFLGLVPTEHSSGGSRSQGSITKTGNTHARRLLVEAAWQHRRPYRTRRRHCGRVGTRPRPRLGPA